MNLGNLAKGYKDPIWIKRMSVLLMGNILYGISTGMNIAIFPILFEGAGLTKWQIGFLGSLEMLTAFLITPFLSRATSKFGFIAIFTAFIVIRNFMLATIPYGDSFEMWIPIMFLYGIGAYNLFIVILFWVNTICNDDNRGFGIASVNFAFSLGVCLGPLLLNLTIGVQGKLPFLISGLIGFSAYIPYMFVKDSMPKNILRPTQKVFYIVQHSFRPIVGGIYADYLFFSLAQFMVIFAMGYGFEKEPATMLITLMLVGGIIIDLPLGYMVDRMKKTVVMMVSGVVILIAIQFLPQIIFAGPFIIVYFVVVFGGLGGVYISALSLLGKRFKGAELSSANAIFGIMNAIGGLAGLNITGLMMDFYGSIGLVYSISMASIIYLTILSALRLFGVEYKKPESFS